MDKPIAVITGANRGIGFEVCRQLASAGHCVIVTGRDRAAGKAACDALDGPRMELRFHQLDVTSDESVGDLASYLDSEFGRLDVLVNNAGVLFDDDRIDASILDQLMERFHITMDVNFYGPLRVCQALVPVMRRSKSGRIVNVSSGLGQLTGMRDQHPAYGISKTALNALTRMVAGATRDDGMLVNSLCPGLVATDMGGPEGRPVKDGADTAVWLAQLPDDGPTGCLFRDREQVPW